ncbi:MAG: signal peptide peptidase SppA [Proteobacteria bacterium]|nr:signal peptide peptidase SppA [Pseudomonadota bacterium]MBU1612240.1 signal peptide peptidase SppA [Pseudomonadota bacterium]
MKARTRFSQRHPFLFGLALLTLAVVLVLGASAIFRSSGGGGSGEDRLGVVYIEGMIVDAEPVVNFIHDLEDDPSIKGVLVRVDSPGGAIAPSQELYQAVRHLNEVMPVVASYGVVAASGGYYASCPAERIVANPGSITGSIGVLLEYLDFHQLAEKVGVNLELLATGSQKGAGSPFRELTPEQREVFTGMLMDMHDQFVSDVAVARSMRKEKVLKLADGRAYTGRQARDNGLVDELGTFDDALEILMQYCGMEEFPELVQGPVDEVPFIDQVLGEGRLEQLVQGLGPRLRFQYR